MKLRKTVIWGSLLLFTFYLSPSSYAIFEDKEKIAMKAELEKLKNDYAKASSELENIKLDRNNLLKQTQTFMGEKKVLVEKIEDIQGSGVETKTEIESLKKENTLLKTDIEKLKEARTKDQELAAQERDSSAKRITDLEARANSLVQMMKEYTPERVTTIIQDRDRLAAENKTMAQRILDHDRELEQARRDMRPLELDREQLHRIQAESRELEKRVQYINELEQRQQQLLKENAEYREKIEILRSKFKDAAPGLAKAGRISQKMMRENADMHYNLGTIFLNNKQHSQAIKEYEQVLELRPNDADTHYNLGVLYDDYLKDRAKALYHYQKYMAINPKAPDAKKVESYILNLELEQKVR